MEWNATVATAGKNSNTTLRIIKQNNVRMPKNVKKENFAPIFTILTKKDK